MIRPNKTYAKYVNLFTVALFNFYVFTNCQIKIGNITLYFTERGLNFDNIYTKFFLSGFKAHNRHD